MRYIRVQSNSMPDHCFRADFYNLQENLIDFEVRYDGSNGLQTIREVNIQFQDDFNALACNYKWAVDSGVPSPYALTRFSGSLDSVVGVAFNGVPFFSGTSELGFDAFKPLSYNANRGVAVNPDICLGDNDYSNWYHYYTWSPCILTTVIKGIQFGKTCSGDNLCSSDFWKHAISYQTQA